MPFTVNYIEVYQVYVLVVPSLSVVYCKHVESRFILCIAINVFNIILFQFTFMNTS